MTLICNNSYSFVDRWVSFALSSKDFQQKDWWIIQNLSKQEYRAYSSSPNVTSLYKKQLHHHCVEKDVYKRVNDLVEKHCVDRKLNFLEFHAFLKGMKKCREDNMGVFQQDARLTEAWKDLLSGYSEKVISLSNPAQEDAPALNAITELAEEMSPQPGLRFMEQLSNKARQAMQYALDSRPTSTPTLSSQG